MIPMLKDLLLDYWNRVEVLQCVVEKDEMVLEKKKSYFSTMRFPGPDYRVPAPFPLTVERCISRIRWMAS